jgi:tetraspanin-11
MLFLAALFYFIFQIGGLVVVSVGIWTLADKAFIQRLLRNELFISSAYILIIAGCIIVFISFLGCFGAYKEIKCMLLTYFIFLFLMFVVLLIGGVLGYVFRNQVEDNFRPEMRHTIEEYDPKDPNNPITAAWDDTQRNVRNAVLKSLGLGNNAFGFVFQLKCCGMGSSDLENKPWLAWRRNTKVKV